MGGGLFAGGLREKRRRGKTIETLIQAPSSWASCIHAMASSASLADVYRMYAMPLFMRNWRFMGISRSAMGP